MNENFLKKLKKIQEKNAKNEEKKLKKKKKKNTFLIWRIGLNYINFGFFHIN